MKILVGPIDLPGQISVDSDNPNNPGIGGSEYHSIVLAQILARDFEVSLWLRSGSLSSSGLTIIKNLATVDDFDLQISFSSLANEETPKPYPLVAISHHPFDSHILDLPSRTLVIANVGDYQLKSNKQLASRAGIPQLWLPVFLRKPQAHFFERTPASGLVVGHLSSLHPSKGFHDVLSAWMNYLAKGGSGTLEVLGGQSLYGLVESHPTLPVSKKYGARLLSIMGGKVHESVKFLGRVPGDVESHIAKWHLAVLNPKGFGESESVSMKDCWRESVPVVAGNRFGQRDYMRLFPSLASSSPRKISEIIKVLSEDATTLSALQKQSQVEYQRLYERGVQSGKLWKELVLKIHEGRGLSSAGMATSQYKLGLEIQIRFEGLQVWLQQAASSLISRVSTRKSSS